MDVGAHQVDLKTAVARSYTGSALVAHAVEPLCPPEPQLVPAGPALVATTPEPTSGHPERCDSRLLPKWAIREADVLTDVSRKIAKPRSQVHYGTPRNGHCRLSLLLTFQEARHFLESNRSSIEPLPHSCSQLFAFYTRSMPTAARVYTQGPVSINSTYFLLTAKDKKRDSAILNP